MTIVLIGDDGITFVKAEALNKSTVLMEQDLVLA